MSLQLPLHLLHKKWSFPLRIFSVNLTKSAGSADFVTFTEAIRNGKLHSLCSVWIFAIAGITLHSWLLIEINFNRFDEINAPQPTNVIAAINILLINSNILYYHSTLCLCFTPFCPTHKPLNFLKYLNISSISSTGIKS